MFDDQGDIDRNGIPDAIQRDPVVAPPEPVPFGVLDPDPGLPGITTPIEATAEPDPELAAHSMAEQQNESHELDMLGSTVEQTIKSIGEGLSSVARK